MAVELEQLIEEEDFQDLITGFNEDELSEYLDSLTDEGDLEEPKSEDPDQVETSIQEGEIFKLGSHRLMCGDATNKEDVEALMNGEKADMVFTDPPYGIDFQSNWRDDKDKFDKIENDKKILPVKKILQDITKKECHWYVFTGHQVYPEWREQFEEYYKTTIIWHKPGTGMGDLKGDYRTAYELCLYCQRGKKKLNGQREDAVWQINQEQPDNWQHPTQKPVELPARALKNSSNQEDIVLDLFAGSGSTLLACEQTQRKAFLLELNPRYCQVIINRWEELTGKKAEPIEA